MLQLFHFRPKGKGSDPKSAFLDKAFYTLQGLAVGVTSLTYHAVQSNGRRISSKPKDIQVIEHNHFKHIDIELTEKALLESIITIL